MLWGSPGLGLLPLALRALLRIPLARWNSPQAQQTLAMLLPLCFPSLPGAP